MRLSMRRVCEFVNFRRLLKFADLCKRIQSFAPKALQALQLLRLALQLQALQLQALQLLRPLYSFKLESKLD